MGKVWTLTQHPTNAERQNAIAEELARHLYGQVSQSIIDQVEIVLKQAYVEGYFEAYIDHSEQERKNG